MRKKCSYCGLEHPFEATICRQDGQPLVAYNPELEAIVKVRPPSKYLELIGWSIGVALVFLFLLTNRRIGVKGLFLLGLCFVMACIALAKILDPWTKKLTESPPEPSDMANNAELPMKCTYCGKRYPEDATVCPVDSELLQRV